MRGKILTSRPIKAALEFSIFWTTVLSHAVWDYSYESASITGGQTLNVEASNVVAENWRMHLYFWLIWSISTKHRVFV